MAKKDFGRRLMPEYLLNYSEELHKNHPDPSASWGGGGGSDYTAGEGIDITGDVISIDEEVVAKKTDIPTVPSVLSAFTNDVGYITGITRTDVTTALGYVPGTSNFSGDYEDLSGKPTIPDSTSDLVNDSGFISGVTSNMITTALGYTPGTSNFSGSYTDLTDKPTIPTVNDPTITFMQGTAIKGTIHLNQSNNQAIVFDAGGGSSSVANVTKVTLTVTYYDGDWTITPPVEDMDSVLQMLTFVEVQEVVSGQTTTVHELTNISVEELSYNIRKFKFIEDTPLANYIERRTIYLTVNWTVTPTTYTWSDYSVVQVNYPTTTSLPWSSITDKPTFATVATSGSYNDLSDKPTIPTVPSVLSAFTNDVGYITGITSSDVVTALGYTPGTSNFSGSYNDLSDKPSIPSTASSTSTSTVTPTTQTLVFTLQDDSTVTVNVMTGATVSTTTTTTLS